MQCYKWRVECGSSEGTRNQACRDERKPEKLHPAEYANERAEARDADGDAQRKGQTSQERICHVYHCGKCGCCDRGVFGEHRWP